MNYLYNGVELPAVPADWNKETHPDAIITSAMSGKLIKLYLGTISYHTQANDRYVFSVKNCLEYREKDGAWVFNGEIEDTNAIASPDEEYRGFVVWTNTDILSSAGSVWLAASDPIPVGGFTPEPISMTMGWLVGRRIAGQRKK